MQDTITLKTANTLFQLGKFDQAIGAYDYLSKLYPQNYWIRLNTVTACIRAGRLHEAKARFERIEKAPQFGNAVRDATWRYLNYLDDNSSHADLYIESPTDYWSTIINGKRIAPIRRIDANKKFPSRYNFELELPKQVGIGNDYRFLENAVNIYRASVKNTLSVLVVIFSESQHSLDLSLTQIAEQTYPSNLVQVLVITFGKWDAKPKSQKYQSILVEYDKSKQIGQINDHITAINSDFIIFLPHGVEHNPFYLEQLSHYYHITDMAVFIFPDTFFEHVGVKHFGMFDSHHDFELFKEFYAFRAAGFSNLVLSTKKFNKLQGFSCSIFDGIIGFKELAYRLFLDGAYFLPASACCTKQEVLKYKYPTGKEKIQNYSAVSWDRKSDGNYLVPKVSIYIPSYNNATFIVESVQSVLDQDFEDLEICICDDGSSDDTLHRLDEKFGNNPKIRVYASAKGGIGSASNNAVSMSRGLYIGQLDSDDLLKPGAVKRLVQFLDDNREIGCVYTSCERIDAEGNYVKPEYSFPVFSREKMLMTSIAHHFRMFRRQAWARTSGFREDILNAVDYDMFLKLSEIVPFYHIDEVFYQRRWHENNTSLINEVTQTKNTTVVQNWSLARQNLETKWKALALDAEQPRKITYHRKSAATRIFFWPDYSTSNPYQQLLYNGLDDSFDVLSGDIKCALKAIVDNPDDGTVVFHLHWINKIVDSCVDVEAANTSAMDFFSKLVGFKKRGGRFVWTIHNTLSHDARFPEIERELMQRLVDAADKIHLHARRSIPEIADSLVLPEKKCVIVRHGNYVGHYPNYVSRADARSLLGVHNEEFVIVFTGQIRPYKGLEELIDAFCSISSSINARLLIAGKASANFDVSLAKQIKSHPSSKIMLVNQFVDDNALQVLYRCADVSVFPYKKILTSGSALLSMTFGIPPILPRVGMTMELIEHGMNGFLFESDIPLSLTEVLLEVHRAKEDDKLFAMGKNALKKAVELDWHGVENLFYQFP